MIFLWEALIATQVILLWVVIAFIKLRGQVAALAGATVILAQRPTPETSRPDPRPSVQFHSTVYRGGKHPGNGVRPPPTGSASIPRRPPTSGR
jgi:hypothetical protein